VATEIASAIGLTNVTATHSRVQDIKEKYNFVVSRAVMLLPELIKICRKNIAKEQINALPNGVICLKGGNIEGEIQPFRNYVEITDLTTYFQEEFFKDKKIVYVPIG
jgi:16S rRNA (guanine527-N7)-methyltransferase